MSTNGAPSRRRPHALVVPFPAQGHLLPLLDFAHRLSTRHGVALTVAVTPSNLPLLSAFLASTPLAAALALPLPDTSSPEHSRQLPPGTHHALLAVHLSGIRGPLLSWASSHSDPPTVVISDFFLGWVQLLADDLRVPRVAFYGVGAFTVAALEHFWNGSLPLDSSSSVVLDPLPGSPSFPYEHVPSVVRSYVACDPDWELVREGFLLNSRAWGAVVNSFDEIEGEFLEYLNRFFGHGRVWAVGPVADSSCRGEERSSGADQLFSWLGNCPPRSVIYACFGSMYKPPPAQAAALGAALEASGARFVWVVGADVAVLPEGLEERTAERGRVVRGWAPQMEILRHGAVGAFLTHCGWNSTLEGVTAGVVLLAWPMKADQFIDARLLIDLHGAGVRAAEGAGSVPDPGALARVFADAVDVGKLAGVRAKISTLAAAAEEVVEEGGSSWIALEKMAKELETACLQSLRIEAIVCLLDKIPITLQQIDLFGQEVAYRTDRIGNIKALLDFLKEARHGGEPIDASSPELHRLMKEAKAAYRDVRSLQPRVVVCICPACSTRRVSRSCNCSWSPRAASSPRTLRSVDCSFRSQWAVMSLPWRWPTR